MTAPLDANVLASASLELTRRGPPALIWVAWLLQGAFTLVVSEHILAEVENTLKKPYFTTRLSLDHIATFLSTLQMALVTPITVPVSLVATHSADDLVLATAVSAHADYLVTGDLKLQALGAYEAVTILSPRAFLDVLVQQGYQP